MPFVYPQMQAPNSLSPGPTNQSPTVICSPRPAGSHVTPSANPNLPPVEPTPTSTRTISRELFGGVSPSHGQQSHSFDSRSLSSGPNVVAAQHPMVTRAREGIFKPKIPYVGLASKSFDLDHPFSREPKNVSEALSSSHWRAAMEAEFKALQLNKTWYLVPPSPHQKVVDSKWVFKVKHNSDDSILKHKARLVAKGFQQIPGVDFGETFSPVIKATTIRTILTLAVSFGSPVRQLDVNNAFLNGFLQEDVFMRQPEGFVDREKPQHVCKLVKALYGLKQAPRAWFDRLRITLLKWGFQNSKCDTSLFFLRTGKLQVFVLIYVDDILITGNCFDFLSRFIKNLNTLFSLKDLGPLNYFLGIEAHRDSSGLYLSQEKYINDLLKKFNMSNCAPVSTPMVTGRKFSAQDGKPMEDPVGKSQSQRSEKQR